MDTLFRLPAATRRDPQVEAWLSRPDEPPRLMVGPWFQRLRDAGRPTACVEDAAFAYVDAFAAHAAVGFFEGASLDDPAGLLRGAGKRMRHVKLKWGQSVDERALEGLIAVAYADMRRRLGKAE